MLRSTISSPTRRTGGKWVPNRAHQGVALGFLFIRGPLGRELAFVKERIQKMSEEAAKPVSAAADA
jgi:hypothetical protein